MTALNLETRLKLAYLFCFIVVSSAITGYFVGMQSPMNPGSGRAVSDSIRAANPPCQSTVCVATGLSGCTESGPKKGSDPLQERLTLGRREGQAPCGTKPDLEVIY